MGKRRKGGGERGREGREEGRGAWGGGKGRWAGEGANGKTEGDISGGSLMVKHRTSNPELRCSNPGLLAGLSQGLWRKMYRYPRCLENGFICSMD